MIGGSSAAATAILSVQAATGSIHAHLLMSGLSPQSSNGVLVSKPQPKIVPSSGSSINEFNNNIVPAPSFPLEVKFESRDAVTGETRIIVEDLSLPSIDNVSIDIKY